MNGSTSSMGVAIGHRYEFVCLDAQGQERWRETVDNLVVNVGLTDIVDKYYKGSTYTAAHYVGLKGTGTIAAGDTMASHAGWTEVTAYSEGVRQTLTLGTVTTGSADNSASKATFSINGSATVGGAFVTTSNTKGGTTGTLVGATDFGASRSVLSGDTLQVTVTVTLTAS